MIRIRPDKLRAAVSAIFARAGCAAEEADTIARRLVEANLAGHDSHGVVRVPQYLDLVKSGAVLPGQHAKTVIDTVSLVVVDGQFGFGQVIGGEAMVLGIQKARRCGVGVVALRNASHLGRIGEWAEQCAAAGMASVHFVNVVGAGALVAPFGGTDARISTNPFACGMPRADGRHVILDFATSKFAEGKVRVALNKGVELPADVLIDNKGKPTRAPKDLYADPRGALLPMGDHKGYGIAMFCDLLAGLLTGGGCNVPDSPLQGKVINNMLSIVLDPAPCGDRPAAMQEMEHFIQWVCASPPAKPGEAVKLPGDPEREHRAERMKNGVPLDDTTWKAIVASGLAVGVDPETLSLRERGPPS